jgi:DNA-directed RNA polymerase subunit RPC12/RpoP
MSDDPANVSSQEYWDEHCRRCGDELADDRDDRLCESCKRHLELEARLNGVRCDRCDGHGYIYGTFCDIQRVMNGRDTRCPRCRGSGTVEWKSEGAV